MKPVVILGAAGVGRRCADIVQQLGWELLGIVDDNISAIDSRRVSEREIVFLGGSTDFFKNYVDTPAVIGIGMPQPRRHVLEKLLGLGVHEFPTILDKSAHLGSSVTLGRGVVVCSGVEISTHTSIGDFVQINPGAVIGHDVRLGDNVSINPGAIVSGEVSIGDSAMVGAGAVILQGLSIGAGAVIGAGSVVTRDVAAGATVKGSPAK